MRLVAPVLVALAGFALPACGQDDAPDERARVGGDSGPPRPAVVAALGDSITAGSPLWDPNPAVRSQIAQVVDPESQYGYWAQLRVKLTKFRNCGVSGERTDEIAARLEKCAAGADVLVVQGGINDIAQRRDPAAAAEALAGMVDRGRELGLRVALVEVLPWNNGYPAADPAIRELNRRIRAFGRSEGVRVFPWYERLEDPRAPGRMRGDWTIDGDHPSVSGYRRLAETVELP